jgi:hypothetical protein
MVIFLRFAFCVLRFAKFAWSSEAFRTILTHKLHLALHITPLPLHISPYMRRQLIKSGERELGVSVSVAGAEEAPKPALGARRDRGVDVLDSAR